MRKILVFVMVLSLSAMLLGCSGTDTSKEANDTTQNTKQEEKQDTSQEKTEPTQDKTEQKDEQAEENDSKAEDSGDHEAQDQILKLYYISDSEEIECAEIRTNLLQTTDIWNGLIGEGVLSSECKMNRKQSILMWIPELVLTSEVWGRQEKNKYLYVLKSLFWKHTDVND